MGVGVGFCESSPLIIESQYLASGRSGLWFIDLQCKGAVTVAEHVWCTTITPGFAAVPTAGYKNAKSPTSCGSFNWGSIDSPCLWHACFRSYHSLIRHHLPPSDSVLCILSSYNNQAGCYWWWMLLIMVEGLAVQIPASTSHMLKCPWARQWPLQKALASWRQKNHRCKNACVKGWIKDHCKALSQLWYTVKVLERTV